jgi:cyclomaltodextrinase
MKIITPDWVKNAIFYQIFPDRFARSPRMHHPQGLKFKSWGSPPEEQGFQGGDLYGVVDKLDYLVDLGINALYLNPIFASASNHRYHTYDYYQVDPLLGGNDALRQLLDEAHQHRMHVVLDGVFNHASRGFWAFHHILETGQNSPYLDWFVVEGWPLRPYNSDKDHPYNYQAWFNLPALPEFNTDNPAVREYIFDVARHWLEFGIDGWRLDVPADIDDDEFWREFRRVVKTANPEAYICGEIWWEAKRWLAGDQFDAVMNYLVTSPLLSFFGGETLRPGFQREHLTLKPLAAPAFARELERIYDLYDWEINYAQLNMLDSHDMPRALWIIGEDKSALKLCILALMTLPGAPCIYYGDEIGLSAAGDPYCRQAFPWDYPDHWDLDLLAHYQKATALRNSHAVLRTGSFQTVHAVERVYACHRQLEGEQAIVIYNAARKPAQVDIEIPGPSQKTFAQVWPPASPVQYKIEGTRLLATVPARDGFVLVSG